MSSPNGAPVWTGLPISEWPPQIRYGLFGTMAQADPSGISITSHALSPPRSAVPSIPGAIGTSPVSQPGVQPSQAYEPTRQEQRISALGNDLNDPRIQALLDVISTTEGADYNTRSGGGTFAGYDRFPGTGNSTASGRYQILAGTYRDLSPKLGLTDFSPNTQDLMAAQLLRQSGATNQLMAGDLAGALHAAAHYWASLPQGPGKTGYYNQPYKPYDFVARLYNRDLLDSYVRRNLIQRVNAIDQMDGQR